MPGPAEPAADDCANHDRPRDVIDVVRGVVPDVAIVADAASHGPADAAGRDDAACVEDDGPALNHATCLQDLPVLAAHMFCFDTP